MSDLVTARDKMTRDNVLREVIADSLGMDEAELPEAISMDTIPEWTSLQHLSIMAAVEERFGIQMSMDEMTEANSIAALSNIVAKYIS